MQFWCGTEVLNTTNITLLAEMLEDTDFTGVVATDRATTACELIPASKALAGRNPIQVETTRRPQAPAYDPWTAIEEMAGATCSLRFVTNISVADEQVVIDFAQRCQEMPAYSRSRVMLAIGNGWMAEEFEHLGDFDNAGPSLGEMIEVLRAAWLRSPPHITAIDSPCSKIPRSSGNPLLGRGESASALHRAARHCDGWMSASLPWRHVAPRVEEVRRLRLQHTAPDDSFEIIVSLTDELSPDLCRRAEEIGVTGITWSPWAEVDGTRVVRSAQEFSGPIEHFADNVISRCR